LSVLFFIWIVVLSRWLWKFTSTWRYAHDTWGFLVLAGKTLIWVVVLGVYTQLLLFSQPDWLTKPGNIHGKVEAKVYNAGSKTYVIDVRTGPVINKFQVDQSVYKELKLENQVKLLYLPVRRDVVRCEIVRSLL
ncbi:MAG TPA: hypothetical protein VFC58_04960, partial [Desulfosporosinus sp.]|nr:hypothetical protein [Desulfosporosinus sp.]